MRSREKFLEKYREKKHKLKDPDCSVVDQRGKENDIIIGRICFKVSDLLYIFTPLAPNFSLNNRENRRTKENKK